MRLRYTTSHVQAFFHLDRSPLSKGNFKELVWPPNDPTSTCFTEDDMKSLEPGMFVTEIIVAFCVKYVADSSNNTISLLVSVVWLHNFHSMKDVHFDPAAYRQLFLFLVLYNAATSQKNIVQMMKGCISSTMPSTPSC